MRFILSLIAALTLSLPAMAQEFTSHVHPGGSLYKNETVDQIRRMQRDSMTTKGFIKPPVVEVSLVRLSYMEDDQIGIQMVVPDVVSGCWEVSPLEYESTFIDPYYFDIAIKHYQRRPVQTDNVQSGCPTENKMSTALIPLSRKDLEERQIRQIRFTNGTIADYYDIQMTDNTLQLKPQSMVVFRGKGLTGPLGDRLEISFGGASKLALHVPMARKGEDITNAITALASQHGLTPDPEMPTSYSAGGSPVFYFKDVVGDVATSIGEEGYSALGTINASRLYDGQEGRAYIAVPLQVFVTKPGTQL